MIGRREVLQGWQDFRVDGAIWCNNINFDPAARMRGMQSPEEVGILAQTAGEPGRDICEQQTGAGIAVVIDSMPSFAESESFLRCTVIC